MPVTRDSLRQVDIDNPPRHRTSPTSQPPVEIADIQSGPPEEVLLANEEKYLYPDQEITRGSFEYSEEGFLGESTASGTFQIRNGSNLFIVRKRAGSAKLENVVDALDTILDEELDTEIDIHEGFTTTRDKIWDFIESAEWVSSIYVKRGGDEVSLANLQEDTNIEFGEIAHQDQVVSADLVFKAPWGDPVNVIYDSGRLEISTEDSNLYEYVIQKFETCVMSR